MYEELSWQSEYWLNCLKEIIPSKRINEGIKYYNNHGIQGIKLINNCLIVKFEENGIIKTKVCFKKFTKKEKRIINTLKYQNEYVNLIEKNIFPRELYDELFKLKINIFPSTIINIDLNCNCSNRKTICKHIIVALYSLTFELEKDPFLLFKLKQSDITNLQYKSEKTEEKNKKATGKVKDVSDLFDQKIEDNAPDSIDLNFDRIPDLNNNLMLLEKNPIFYENFRNVLEEIFKIFNDYYENYLKKYDINENKIYHDFIEIQLPNTYRFKTNNSVNNHFILKWGKYNSWKTLQINLNSNYSITKINTTSKDNFSKYKSEKILFGFLTELKQVSYNKLSKNLSFMLKLYDFSMELINKNAIIPELFICNDKCLIRWIPAYSNKEISEIIYNLSNDCPQLLITFNKQRISPKNQVITCVSLIIKGFIDNCLDENYELKNNNTEIVQLFLGNSQKLTDIKNMEVEINNWLKPFNIQPTVYKIYFEILEEDDNYKVIIKIKINDKMEDILTVLDNITDEKLNKEIKKDIKIIKKVFPKINVIYERENIILTPKEFSNFFNDIFPMLETIGVEIILPKNLNNKFNPRLILDVENKNINHPHLSIENIYKFDWKIAIDDKTFTIKEFEKLTNESKTLIKIADKNVILDKTDVEKIIKKIEELPETLSNYELIKCIATGEYSDITIDVSEKIKNQLINPNGMDIALPKSINGILRPYQLIGYKWLAQNFQCQFGSILADDMGLGKTFQVLTLILKLKEDGLLDDEKVLVITPTSLLYNWQREINKFTPELLSFIYHGPNRNLKNKSYDILLTSYAIVRQDKNILNKKKWLVTVVDEAQNIKNVNTKQTKAIKSINSKHHIALTGTPIENRLSEYCSIFDFTNKGYLGTLSEFKKKYIVPIENDRNLNALENLKLIAQPFILRRLKTDEEIMDELPEKISNEVYCNLTPIQAAIYQETLNIHMKTIKEANGINRRGHVLELINALKQICNHPAQYSKNNEVKLEDSGKMRLLMDELQSILESDEKVIIFTQYVKTGHIIKKLVEKHLKEKVLFLHGSLSRKERDKQVTLFQENSNYKIFVISIKAGGTGLNLTAASNVIHYDLWWNPAVENQATDRAYRIGQKSNVMVYRFITTGTFEERINDMIEDKKELSEITISNGGSFITEMDDEKLKEILRLKDSY